MENNKKLNQFEADRLSFKSHNDALDYANKLVEDSLSWLAIHNWNVADGYKNIDFEIRWLVRGLGPEARNYHLVFRAIPTAEDDATGPLHVNALNRGPGGEGPNGANDSVFIGVTRLVQSPQEVIPS